MSDKISRDVIETAATLAARLDAAASLAERQMILIDFILTERLEAAIRKPSKPPEELSTDAEAANILPFPGYEPRK